MTDQLDVYINGRKCGHLLRTLSNGDVAFTYDEEYRADPLVPPLSLSMPKAQSAHSAEVTGPWIDNLLPDNDDVRQRWAADYNERRVTAFNLLAHVGEDCPGAVQIVPPGTNPTAVGARTPVDRQGIADRLRVLRKDESAWNDTDFGGLWSLGGQQGKFALMKALDGSWHAPSGGEPSTHIFKVGITRFTNGDTAEYVTMRAARSLGLEVANIELMRFDDEIAMVVERYDRLTMPSGDIVRIHQEDMCQASGLWRSMKYQSDGGPGVSDVVRLVDEASTGSDAAASQELFVKAVVFNWLTAGTDAHAKNYAFLLAGQRARLAPLYDLTSGCLLLPANQLRYKGKLAMKFGGEYRLNSISNSAVIRAAQDLRIEPDWLIGLAEAYSRELPDAFEEAAASAGDLIDKATQDRFNRGIQERVGYMRLAKPRPKIRKPAWDMNHNAEGQPQQRVGYVWVPPHTRNGKRTAGHWRKLPTRRR